MVFKTMETEKMYIRTAGQGQRDPEERPTFR